MTGAKRQTRTHIFVPDTQIEPGVPTQHVEWIGQFIHDEYAGADLAVIVGGDWWNMGSLSSFDKKGGTKMEGRRYIKDVDSGNGAWDRFNEPWKDVEADRYFTMGNHEYRVVRAAESDAQLEGVVTLDHLAVNQWEGWNVSDFLVPVWIDGVCYSHYFVQPMTGRPYGGANVELRLKQVGHSFTMGHQQGFRYGEYPTIKGTHHGLVAGSCYFHDEDYLTAQVTNYWRGIVVCHQVEHGEYDLMKVSLDYLCRRYEGKRLSAVKWRH